MSYFSAPGVNWSTLKHMRDSPKAYAHSLTAPHKDTAAILLGRALHCMVFEPGKFHNEYTTWTAGDKRGKQWEAFKAEAQSSAILTADEFLAVDAMADAVRSDSTAAAYLAGCEFEVPVFWTDPETGIECKAKLDAVNRSRRLLLDLKSTRSVDGRRFGAESARYCYPQQMAHYENACRYGLDFEPCEVVLLGVEKQAPNDVGAFEIDLIARQLAGEEVRALLLRVKECRESGYWPGRYTEKQALQLPAWVYSDDDEDDANGYGLSIGSE